MNVDGIDRHLRAIQAAIDEIDRDGPRRTGFEKVVSLISIAPVSSMHEAIAQLTRTERRILLVCDAANVLLGTLTDYDIRCAILAGLPFDTPVAQIMARTPIVLVDGLPETEVAAFMRRQNIHYVPIVDRENRVVDVRFLQEFMFAEKAERRVAVVMAGGFGRRLRPFTDDVPKPMLAVGGRPILFIILDQIIAEGFTDVYVSLHYKSDFIVRAVNAVARYRGVVKFIHEREPLGTAGSLSLLPERPTQPFLVINGDLVTQVPLDEMFRYHEHDRNVITVATKVDHYTVPFGVIEAVNGRVVGIREKPKLEYIVNLGAYVLSPTVLDDIASGERVDMPELICSALTKGKPVGRFPVHEYWLDVGTPEQYERANNECAVLKLDGVLS